ncbi:hypothetical protein ME763_25680 [Streptomyces murinus]|uniref:hypothetical protein n=1 Tax=Streptomyces murinus TaxID=33900 RepID=UPI000A1F384E|nr:hypothetical protein [Streptomyces murinus]WDO08759.1 hypothetical protein ME763_25680 [Streptomyces murinus]
MTRALHEALSGRADCSRLELPDADRTLDRWFRDRPESGRRLVSALPVAPGSLVGALPGAAVDQRL